MQNSNTLVSTLTAENAKIATKEIVDTFIKKGDESNIEIDYKITFGVASSHDTNTIFKFNFVENSFLSQLAEVAASVEELSNDEHDAMLAFEKMIINEIEDKYFDTIKAKLRGFTPLDHDKMSKINPITRQKILETIFPMKNSKIVSCFFNLLFVPDGDDGYILMVNKNSPKPGLSTTSVSNDLIKRHSETGKNFDEIIKDRKAAGDDQYKYVVSVTKKYYEYQCQLSLHVDYSPAPKEEVDAKIKDLI